MFRRRPRLAGALVGFAVTAICITYLFRYEEGRRLELWAFDLRVKHCNSLSAKAPIVHIDIDDSALDRVGRWPWHRDRLADIIRILHELGAANIIVDLLLSEPEGDYFEDPRLSAHVSVETNIETVGELSEANRVHPDLELAEALRSAGNVILACEFEVVTPDDPKSLRDRIKALGPEKISIDDAISALHLANTPEKRDEVRKHILRLRVLERLEHDFSLTDEQLAAALGQKVSDIADVIAGVKRDAARQLVISAAPNSMMQGPAGLEETLTRILGGAKNRMSADRADIVAAYFTQLGTVAAGRSMENFVSIPSIELCRWRTMTPPHYLLARAARAVAAVYPTHDPDGLVRRVPIVLANQPPAFFPHMGLAAAMYILDIDPARIAIENHSLVLPTKDWQAGRRIPLDADGNMIIFWTSTASKWRENRDFEHVTAAKVYAIADARRQIRQNEISMNYKLADVVAVTKGQLKVSGVAGKESVNVAADNAFRKKINDQLELEQRIRLGRLKQELSAAQMQELQDRSQRLLDEIHRDQRQAIAAVRAAVKEFDEQPPDVLASDPVLAEDARNYRRALEIIDKEIPPMQAANQHQHDTISALLAELSPKVKDKHVFLGYAATAEGDIVATPIDHRTNGVMCHAHVLNDILRNRFIAPVDCRWEIAACILMGAVVSLITARLGPGRALLETMVLMAVFTAFNAYVLFMRLGVLFTLAAPLLIMFVTWAFVTLFRQLTAEREKRLFAKQLSQYTSPAIAARIAENPDAIAAFQAVQTREMTIFFSDLAGFTTMSEQENPETIQHVLNAYLKRMSEVIWSRRGLVSKFIGDGIMALFNPSVDPLSTHAQVACETGLAALDELDKLKAEYAGDSAARLFDKLSMRIGLSTGPCKNGDLGSELKADYTAIGDVVNLAARLEPANKVFGTRIMVSSALHDAVKDAYEFRYLAELQVKGKATTVPVYEIICRKGELTEEQRQYIERFEAGVDLYKQQKWDECIVHFTRILSRRPDDLGASRYIDACQEFKRFPPEDGWAGALELKEK